MSIADEILKMNELRASGVISDEEFEAQKRRLLDGAGAAPAPVAAAAQAPAVSAEQGVVLHDHQAKTVVPAHDDDENNSGRNEDFFPEGIVRWGWGPFFWNWLWAICNNVWIGLLALIPYVGLLVAIYLGSKGRALAWKSKRWNSVEHFNEVQKKWDFWAAVIFFGVVILLCLAFVVAELL